LFRLLELAPNYYDLSTFIDGEYTRALKKVNAKRSSKPHLAMEGRDGRQGKSSTPGERPPKRVKDRKGGKRKESPLDSALSGLASLSLN
jgi:hypothetical protein